jgi:5-(carboxyamino)imidazole ribonucleotide synthase
MKEKRDLGIIGGGQLARMLALAAANLGLRCSCLDPADNACAGIVSELVVADFSDQAALQRLAQQSKRLTYEFENVSLQSLSQIAAQTELAPNLRALEVSQHRVREKQFFKSLGIATPAFQAVNSVADAQNFAEQQGYPLVLKTCSLGYDGKGQAVVHDASQLEPACERLLSQSPELIAEQFIPFDFEVSCLAVRSRQGTIAFYPLTQNWHRQGILRISLAPAPQSSKELEAQAQQFVRSILQELDYVGVLALELFASQGKLFANELAPRVHNSGHWTIDGAQCSQFENHVRAVCDLPLGNCGLPGDLQTGYSAMLNLIGQHPPLELISSLPRAKIHLYGKQPRPGRKIGHVNFTATSFTGIMQELLAALPLLTADQELARELHASLGSLTASISRL